LGAEMGVLVVGADFREGDQGVFSLYKPTKATGASRNKNNTPMGLCCCCCLK
jgi:hypothetical protein